MSGVVALLNGSVLDGSGSDTRSGGVLLNEGRITAVGAFELPAECRVLDCAGLTIAPGFIDGHSHSDLQALDRRMEKVLQGVTSEVVGNCGFSAYPCPDDPNLLHAFANGIFCGGEHWGWPGAREYLASAQTATTSVLSLVGHGSLRIACCGNRMGEPTASEIDRMEGMLDDALSTGACGFSTGLMYAPGSGAPEWELDRLCRVVAKREKIYTTHMRDYSGKLLDAVNEQISLARRSGCRLQISHFQAVGQRFWAQQRPALDAIEQAAAEGIDIGFDVYPYIAGSTVLTQLLPQWTLEGGTDALLKRLRGLERARIAVETDTGLAQTWQDIHISSVAHGAERLVGRSVAELAAERASTPAETVLDLLLEQDGDVNILEFNQSESNLRETLTHPLANVISDGFYVKGRPHPRLHGTFPTLLGEYVRERGWLTLAEAVHKVTGAPAARFGMGNRGALLPGYQADLVVFDAQRIGSPASYADPEHSPVGIHAVIRGGEIEWLSDYEDGGAFRVQ